jgi:hypothetical protein
VTKRCIAADCMAMFRFESNIHLFLLVGGYSRSNVLMLS